MNVALNRTTFMSSTYSNIYGVYHSSYANDGNNNSSIAGYSCAHTYSDVNPWWGVDLGTAFFVVGVLFTNRADGAGNVYRPIHIHYIAVFYLSVQNFLLRRLTCDITLYTATFTTFDDSDFLGLIALPHIHRVSKKLCKLIFCHNFAKFRRTVKIFGKKTAERTGFSAVYSFSTLPNLCQHTTV